jgi:hypothetical protein
LIPAAEELGYYGLAERTKRLASHVPDLDILSQGLVERLNGGWRVTEKGRSVLTFIALRLGPTVPSRSAPKTFGPRPRSGFLERRAGAAVNAGSAAGLPGNEPGLTPHRNSPALPIREDRDARGASKRPTPSSRSRTSWRPAGTAASPHSGDKIV